MRHFARFVALTLLAAAAIVGGVASPAVAVRSPRTLAHTAAVGASPVEPGFPIDFVGVLWDGEHGDATVRFRHDGRWTPWQAAGEDGAEVPGRAASALVAAGDADAYQVRVPAGARHARAVAINTTDGPDLTVATRPGGDAAGAAAVTDYLTRAEWGADESLRFDAAGTETWPATYYPVQKLTVHHTDTGNGDADPAATVRAIYRYHAIDRAFGDIGYQYLVDEAGRVYEGRWSGTDGDPGHDGTGRGVTAAHVGGANSGNLGVALLGTFTQQAPTTAAQSATEGLLADLSSRHGLDPKGSSTYVNPVNGSTWAGPNISGHRDWAATECPGGALYAQLPTIRQHVADRLAPASPAPDTAAPVITNVRVASVTSTSATVTWTTNEPSDSQVQWWAKGSTTRATTPLDASTVTSHRVTITGLKARTSYQYRVRSADAAGNVAWSTAGAFTTPKR